MTPLPDSLLGKQRMAHMVLGDMLDMPLSPMHHWSIGMGAFVERVDVDGWVNEHQAGQSAADVLIAWSRELWAPIFVSTYPSASYQLWYCQITVNGILVTINARIDNDYAAEHAPPVLEAKVPPRVDMYVRRSAGGQLVEATS